MKTRRTAGICRSAEAERSVSVSAPPAYLGPDAHVEHVHLDGDDAEKAAKLADLLDERKFLQ